MALSFTRGKTKEENGGIIPKVSLHRLLISSTIFFCLFGAFFTTPVQSGSLEISIFYPEAISSLKQFESDLGLKFYSCKWYEDWSDPFYSDTAASFKNHGCLPELTWQPQTANGGVAYDDVISGKYDSYIDQFASSIKSFGSPVRVSLAPEMNSEWVGWGIGKNGNNPENHKAFWRYVVNRFRNQGASNVFWVWAANIRFYGDPCSYSDIFPGDEYIDYAGLDGYNWGTSQSWSTWQSFSEVFSKSYNELSAVSGKEFLIMEVASAEVGGNKGEWISGMFSDLRNKFPRIKGFTWFSINKETDWRINSSESSKNAFINGALGRTPSGSAGTENKASESSTKTGTKKKASTNVISNSSMEKPDQSLGPNLEENKIENAMIDPEKVRPKTLYINQNSTNQNSKGVYDYPNKILLAAKLFCVVCFLFILLVFLVNFRLHRTHLNYRY